MSADCSPVVDAQGALAVWAPVAIVVVCIRPPGGVHVQLAAAVPHTGQELWVTAVVAEGIKPAPQYVDGCAGSRAETPACAHVV